MRRWSARPKRWSACLGVALGSRLPDEECGAGFAHSSASHRFELGRLDGVAATAPATSNGCDAFTPEVRASAPPSRERRAEARWTRREKSSAGRDHVRDAVRRVEDAVEVLRPGRDPAPAYVVACDDAKRVRPIRWTPGEGPVAFRVMQRGDGVEEAWVAR